MSWLLYYNLSYGFTCAFHRRLFSCTILISHRRRRMEIEEVLEVRRRDGKMNVQLTMQTTFR